MRRLAGSQGADDGRMCHQTEGENESKVRKSGDLCLQELIAGSHLDRQRPIFGRHASYGICNQGPRQLQVVVGPLEILTLGKSERQQRGIEQRAGVIAREGTPGSISAS